MAFCHLFWQIAKHWLSMKKMKFFNIEISFNLILLFGWSDHQDYGTCVLFYIGSTLTEESMFKNFS